MDIISKPRQHQVSAWQPGSGVKEDRVLPKCHNQAFFLRFCVGSQVPRTCILSTCLNYPCSWRSWCFSICIESGVSTIQFVCGVDFACDARIRQKSVYPSCGTGPFVGRMGHTVRIQPVAELYSKLLMQRTGRDKHHHAVVAQVLDVRRASFAGLIKIDIIRKLFQF